MFVFTYYLLARTHQLEVMSFFYSPWPLYLVYCTVFFSQFGLQNSKEWFSRWFLLLVLVDVYTIFPYPKFYHHLHHHHVVLVARISLTLSRHFSLSFIASGRSGLHPVSAHSCCMYVRAGRPAFARPYEGVHKSTSLMSSSLLLQQCLVRLAWIVFVMGGRWPYSWCLVGCCRQKLFKIARSILV